MFACTVVWWGLARARSLQAWVYGLAFEGQNAEDAFVDAVEGGAADEAFQRLDAEGELAQGERPLGGEVALAQPVQVFWRGVFGAVNEPEVLPAAALYAWLRNAAPTSCDEIQRLDDHALAAAPGARDLFPSCHDLLFILRVRGIRLHAGRLEQHLVLAAELRERLQVPVVVPVQVELSLGGEQVERRELQVLE